MGGIRAEILALDALQAYPRNPKLHDLGAIRLSIDEFGFIDRIVINETTGNLIAGHGRLLVLAQMYQQGDAAPDGIEIVEVETDEGAISKWALPVDFVRVPASKEAAAVIALNRTTELGGWNEQLLLDLLNEIQNDAPDLLYATGYDSDDLDEMLKNSNPLHDGNLVGGDDDPFAAPPEGFEITVIVPNLSAKQEVMTLLSTAGYTPRVKVSR